MSNQWIILTAGNDLCLQTLKNLEPYGVIKSIIIDKETIKWRRSALQKLKNNYKYSGIKGITTQIISKLKAKKSPSISSGVKRDIYQEYKVVAESVGAKLIFVDDINSIEVEDYLKSIDAKYGMLIGTSIVKENIINSFSGRLVNIHQGKIPEYRGGSIVFWSLFNQVDSFWITTHKVEKKVDAGKIYKEKSVTIPYDYKVYGLNYNNYIKEVGDKLNTLSVVLITETIININLLRKCPKDINISDGIRYRKPTYKEKLKLIKNLKMRYK